MRCKVFLVVLTTALCGVMFLFPGFLLADSSGGVILISNKGVTSTGLSRNEVKKIYTGKKTRWENGLKIDFVILESGDVHKSFLKKYLKKTPTKFKSYWNKRVFTGSGQLPRTFTKESRLIEYVANNKGAIGYVSKSAQTDNVKIISVH